HSLVFLISPCFLNYWGRVSWLTLAERDLLGEELRHVDALLSRRIDWLQWIEEQGPPPLQKAANTIAEHFEGVCDIVARDEAPPTDRGDDPLQEGRDLVVARRRKCRKGQVAVALE